MRSAARLVVGLALCLALVRLEPAESAVARSSKANWLRLGGWWSPAASSPAAPTATLIRDFEGFAVSSTVIMLNMQALKDLPRPVQWLIYYHECGHILYGPSETRRRLLRGAAGAPRRLAHQGGARGYLRGLQHRRPRPGPSGPRGPLRPAQAMLRHERREPPRRR